MMHADDKCCLRTAPLNPLCNGFKVVGK